MRRGAVQDRRTVCLHRSASVEVGKNSRQEREITTEVSARGRRQTGTQRSGGDYALEATNVEGTIILEEAEVDELVVDREPVDARVGGRVSLVGGEGVEGVLSRCGRLEVGVRESGTERAHWTGRLHNFDPGGGGGGGGGTLASAVGGPRLLLLLLLRDRGWDDVRVFVARIWVRAVVVVGCSVVDDRVSVGVGHARRRRDRRRAGRGADGCDCWRGRHRCAGHVGGRATAG